MEKNDGKLLEKIVRLIHETLKDRPDTLIIPNHKLKNESGRKREFDLFIQSTINGIIVRIVIECKAYKTPIKASLIEAFNGKCDRIPIINRRVFVSQSGYQADAINAAKEFGIELCSLQDINKESIIKWFPISQLGLIYQLKKFNLVFDTSEDALDKLRSEGPVEFFENGSEKIDIKKFIDDSIKSEKNELWQINVMEFLRKGGSKSIGERVTLPFHIHFEGAYVVAQTGSKYDLVRIEGEIESWFIEKELQVSSSQSYNVNNEVKAGRLSIGQNKGDGNTEIIVTKNNFKVFHTDQGGTAREFQLLASYDPKTGRFTDETKGNEKTKG